MRHKIFTPGQARALRLRVAEAEAEGFRKGHRAGAESVLTKIKSPDLLRETLEAKIKLINAVGQTMSVQANLLQGLGQVFDCGPH